MKKSVGPAGLQKAGRLRIAPKLFRSVAEALAPDVRDLVKGVWNAPVADGYTATDAVALIADAMRLDPHHSTWYSMELGLAHFAARQYAEAIAAIRHRPDLQCTAQVYLAACHAQLGEDEAMRAAAAEGPAPAAQLLGGRVYGPGVL